MFAIYQSEITPNLGKRSAIMLLQFETFDAAEFGPMLRSLGFDSEIPATAPFSQSMILSENGATSYTLGVGEVTFSSDGNPDHPVLSETVTVVDGAVSVLRTHDGNPAPMHRTLVSRVEFKMLFTIAEQVAIRMARAYSGTGEPELVLKFTLDALYDVLDDPQMETLNLEVSMVAGGLASLVQAGLITEVRRAEIALGVPIT